MRGATSSPFFIALALIIKTIYIDYNKETEVLLKLIKIKSEGGKNVRSG
jgi:hypothetical protein